MFNLFKKWRQCIFFVCLSLICIPIASAAGTNLGVDLTVAPSELQQGDSEISVTVTLDTTTMKVPTTWQTGGPSFSIAGVAVDSELTVADSGKSITANVSVPRGLTPGEYNVTLWFQEGPGEHVAATAVDYSIGTLTIISKPEVYGVAPAATYQQSSKDITVFGDYFDTSGNSKMQIVGAGLASASTTPSEVDEVTFTSVNLSNALPSIAGQPYFIRIVSNDGGQGVSAQGLLTLYPAPAVSSASPSVFQGQQNATVFVRGTGFYQNSSVIITETGDITDVDDDITIAATAPNPDTGIIQLTLNVNKGATIGDKYFWVVNPDGQSGISNISYTVISDFVTDLYEPTIGTSASTTTVQQGFSGIINISSSTTTSAFEVGSTVSVQGDGITVGSVETAEGADITTSGNIEIADKLSVYLTVAPDAELGVRMLTVTNPTYGTEASYEITVTTSPESNLPNSTLTLSTSVYVGLISTMTITTDDAAFEEDSTVAISNIDDANITTTFISTGTLWVYVDVPADTALGQQTLTITNPTYSVTKSTYVSIEESAYSNLAISSISPSTTVYHGQTSTMTITCTGAIEELEDQTESISVSGGLTINSVVRQSDTVLWINFTVDKTIAVGEQFITITNPSYNVSSSTSIYIDTSEYSSPTITTTSVTLYKGEEREVLIEGTGFHDSATFATSNANVSITSTQILSASQALLSIAVLNIEGLEDRDYSLTVTNTDFEASYTVQDLFDVNNMHEVTAVSPYILTQGSTQYFYINGTDFISNSAFDVSIDEVLVSTDSAADNSEKVLFISSRCVSEVQIAAEVAVGTAMPTGLHDVSLYFESNQSTFTLTGAFFVPNEPEITSITTVLSQGDTNKEGTVLGSNFEQGANVEISGTGIIITTTTANSDGTLIRFKCDVLDSAEKGDRTLTVINPSGQLASETIKVIAPPKNISVSPSSVMKGTTRYIEIAGENFNENFDLVFSGTTTYEANSDTPLANSIHVIDSDFTGETNISAEVYIGTDVVSGPHDITIINYDDSTKTNIESEGKGPGVFTVRTPLSISNDVNEYTVPAGYTGKQFDLTGEGFSEEGMTIEFSGTGITITNQNYINSKLIELTIDVSPLEEISLGKRTVTVRYNDDSAYKQILEVIQPVTITDITPYEVPIGLRFATMTISAVGLDLDTTTLTTVTIDGNTFEGIDPADQVEVIGDGIENLIIDSTTYSSSFLTLYFTCLSTATVGTRDIIITNQDNENVLQEKDAFSLVESVAIELFTPSQYQPTAAATAFKLLGTGFDGNYQTGTSTITFTNSNIGSITINYDDADEIQGTFTWTGSTTSITSDRYVDISAQNADGSIGKLENAIYLLEELTIIEELTTPATIPIDVTNFILHVKGKGFIEGADASVSINGDTSKVTINETEYISSEELKVNLDTDSSITADTAGTLIVTNPSGASVSETILRFQTLPTITSISPSFVRVGGSKDITITGTNFDLINSTASISFSNGLFFSTSSISAIQMVGTVQTSQSSYAGDVTIYMSTYTAAAAADQVQSVSEGLFKVLGEPRIDQIYPTLKYADKTGPFYIFGKNFDAGIELELKEVSSGVTTYATITADDGDIRDTDARITVDELTITQQGDYTVTLTNPDGSKIVSKSALTVDPAATQAIITSLSPQHGLLGETGIEVDVSGANFEEDMTIDIEGVGVTVTTSAVSYSAATVTLDITANTVLGAHNLVFSNPNATSATKKFYVMAEPVVTSITPNKLKQNTTIEVSVIGENFIEEAGADGGNISFDITGDDITVLASSATFVGPTEIKGLIYVGHNAEVGIHGVSVTNPFETKGDAVNLLEITSEIQVTSIDHTVINRGDIDREITINGSGFIEGLGVDFITTGVQVTNVEYVSNTQIVLKVTVLESATLGSTGLKITNPNEDTVSINNIMEVVPKVIVERLSVTQVRRGVTTQGIEVIGSNFDVSTNTIAFSGEGLTVSNVETKGTGSITFDLAVTAGATLGDTELTLTTENGTEVKSPAILEIIDAVSVNSVIDNSTNLSFIKVSTHQATSVELTISGSGFSNVNSSTPTISFTGGDITLVRSTYTNSTELTAEILIDTNPALGKRDITITNGDSTFGDAEEIIELVLPLSVSTCTPTAVTKGAENAAFTVTGYGFRDDMVVQSNSSDVTVDYAYKTTTEASFEVSVSSAYATDVATITLRNIYDVVHSTVYITCNTAPIVTSIAPATVGQGATTTITMTGYSLADVTERSKVIFDGNGITISSITSVSATSLAAIIQVSKSAAPAVLNLTLTDENGAVGVSSNIFEIVPAPSVVSLGEPTLLAGTTQNLTITGSGFEDGAVLSFPTADAGDITVSNYSYINGSLFYAQVYTEVTTLPGNYVMTIRNPDNSSSEFYVSLETLREPIISSITPSKLAFGIQNTYLTIRGSNFEEGAIVNFGGGEISISSQIVTSNEINLRVSVTEPENPVDGYRQVEVANSLKSTTTINSFELYSIPSVSSLSLAQLTQGTTNYTVKLNGKGFTGTTASISVTSDEGISISNVDVIGPNQITFDVYVGTDAKIGKHGIEVTTVNGIASENDLFEVVPPLTVSSADPTQISVGSNNRNLWIYGTGFNETTELSFFDGEITLEDFYYKNETTLQAVISISNQATLGGSKITLFNQNGDTISDDTVFEVIPAVTVKTISETKANVGIIDLPISITGTEYVTGAEVTFSGSGITVTTVTVVTATKITAFITIDDDADTGSRNVTVTNTNGNTGTKEAAFVVEDEIEVNTVENSDTGAGYFTLTQGATTQDIIVGGNNFKISASGEVPTLEFSLGSITVDSTTVAFVNSSQLTATIIINTTTAQGGSFSDVRVRNYDGTTGVGRDKYFLVDDLEITRVIPDGLARGSQEETITILGAGFVDGLSVAFSDSNEITVNSVKFIDSQSVEANISLTTDATLDYSTFTVTNPQQTSGVASTDTFQVLEAPVILSVYPESFAQGAEDQTLTITGIDFAVNNTTVTITGGVTVSSASVNASSDTITVTLSVDDNAGIGTRNITVEADGKEGIGRNVLEITTAPTIDTVQPPSAVQGAQDKKIDITGEGYTAGSVVRICDDDEVDAVGVTINNASITSDKKIQLTIDVSSTTSVPGFYDIKISNTDGSEGKGVGVLEIKEPPVPPVLESISPIRLKSGEINRTIIIKGYNFQQGMSVSFSGGDVEVSSITYSSDNSQVSVEISLENAAVGLRTLTFANLDGGISVYADEFEIYADPTITSIEPSAAILKSTSTSTQADLTINGTSFKSETTLQFSNAGITIDTITYKGSSQIGAQITVSSEVPAGNYDITVINPYGATDTSEGILHIIDPIVISSVTPQQVVKGSVDQEIKIWGSGFTANSTLEFTDFGITVNNLELRSSNLLVARISLDANADESLRKVTVKNADGITSEDTGVDKFEVIGLPVITSIEPSPAILKSTNTSTQADLTINGTSFKSETTLQFSNAGITIDTITYKGSSQIGAQITVSSEVPAGNYDMTVVNPYGVTISSEGILHIIDPIVISSVTPQQVVKGSVDQEIKIWGSGFTANSTLEFTDFGITVNNLELRSSNLLVARISLDANADESLRKVTVKNADGITSEDTGVDKLEVYAEPTITSIEPSAAILKSTNTSTQADLTINGTSFKSETTLQFSNAGITIDTVTYIGSSQIGVQITVSSEVPAGDYDMTVVNPYGATDTSEGILHIIEPIVISSVTPQQVRKGAVDQEIKIWGSAFTANSTLEFTDFGITVNNLELRSSNLLVARISLDADATESLRKVTVKNADGITSEDTGVDKFEVIGLPVVTSIEPSAMQQDSEGWINIYGTGLYGSPSLPPTVEFSGFGITVATVTYGGSTDIRAYIVVDATATITQRHVTVIGQDESSTRAVGEGVFSVEEKLAVTNLSISKIPQGDNDRVISVVGTGFAAGATVEFETGIEVERVTFQNSGQLEIIVDVQDTAELSAKDITVTNPNNEYVTVKDILEIVEPIIINQIEPDIISLGVTNKEIIITGQNFESNSEVEIFGTGITYSTVSYSNTEIVLYVTVDQLASLTKRDIRLTAPSGNRGETTEAVEVINGITVSKIEPKYLVKGVIGSTITLTGSNFEYGLTPSTITISGTGVTITSHTATKSTSFTMVVDVDSTATRGSRDIILENSDGTIGRVDGGVKVVDVLEVTRVEPSGLGKGATNEVIDIYGTGFIPESVVSFEAGSGITVDASKTEYKSSDYLKATITIPEDTTVDSYDITVTNAIMGFSTTTLNAFDVTSDPVILTASPSEIRQGAQEQAIVLTGKNFVVSTETLVEVSGVGVTVSSTVVVSTEIINIIVDLDKTASIGSRNIIVTNPRIGVSSSFGIGTNVLSVVQGPNVSGISPDFIDLGATKTIGIQGKGFASGISVSIPDSQGLSISNVNFVNAQQIEVDVTASANAVLGTYDVYVVNVDSSSDVENSIFSVISPPVVTQVGTPIVKRGQENLFISIFGSHFQEGASVFVSGLTVSSVTYISTSELEIVASVDNDAPEGKIDVRVTNPSGSVGIGEDLIEVRVIDPVINSLSINSNTIDYEKYISTLLTNSVTISYELSQTVTKLEFQILKTTGIAISEPEVVRRWIFNNVEVGEHNIEWNGLIKYIRSDTNESSDRKENNNYMYKLLATTDQGQTTEVYGTEEIKVDVVHISDHYVSYTQIGAEGAKVAPYMLHYYMTKDAYTNIVITNSSGTAVKQYTELLSNKGDNAVIWDGRDESGLRVSKGLYKATISAYDNSDPRDYADDKTIDIMVNQLRIVDFKIATISSADDNAKITFTPAETMRIDMKIYRPGTSITDVGNGQVVASPASTEVKTYNLFVEKDQPVEILWNGVNDRGDILVDGLYPVSIVGIDANGTYMSDPLIADIPVSRGANISVRRDIFQTNFYAYPNPVDLNKRQNVNINYGVNKKTELTFYVYDIIGNLVWKKNLGIKDVGLDILEWKLVTKANERVGRGIYIVMMEGKETESGEKLKATNKLMVIK